MKILFSAQPSVGHTRFMISLAEQMSHQGHDVIFIVPGLTGRLEHSVHNPASLIIRQLRERSVPYRLIPPALTQLWAVMRIGYKTGMAETAYVYDAFAAGCRKYLRFMERTLCPGEFDLQVCDYTFFPALLLQQKYKLKTAVVYHSGLLFPEFPVPPLGSGFKYNAFSIEQFREYLALFEKKEKTVNRKLRRVWPGWQEQDLLIRPGKAWMNLVTYHRETDYPRSVPADLCYMGAGIAPEKEMPSERRHIYISMGTVFDRRAGFLESLIRALLPLGLPVTVAAGRSARQLKKRVNLPGVSVYQHVDQLAVLKDSCLFVTHGGRNSISEAMALAVPMLVFPSGGEQVYNADMVEYLGTGIHVSMAGKTPDPHCILSAARHLISDSAVRETSDRYFQLHQEDGAERACRHILSRLESAQDSREPRNSVSESIIS